jgi:hypothetical protein
LSCASTRVVSVSICRGTNVAKQTSSRASGTHARTHARTHSGRLRQTRTHMTGHCCALGAMVWLLLPASASAPAARRFSLRRPRRLGVVATSARPWQPQPAADHSIATQCDQGWRSQPHPAFASRGVMKRPCSGSTTESSDCVVLSGRRCNRAASIQRQRTAPRLGTARTQAACRQRTGTMHQLPSARPKGHVNRNRPQSSGFVMRECQIRDWAVLCCACLSRLSCRALPFQLQVRCIASQSAVSGVCSACTCPKPPQSVGQSRKGARRRSPVCTSETPAGRTARI